MSDFEPDHHVPSKILNRKLNAILFLVTIQLLGLLAAAYFIFRPF